MTGERAESASGRAGKVGGRELGWLIALTCLAAPGALASHRGAPDPLALLAWLALLAAPAGALACSLRLGSPLVALAVPAAWMIPLTLVDGLGARNVPAPAYAGLALAGLFLGGWGTAAAGRSGSWQMPLVLLLWGAFLAGLPSLFGLAQAPWSAPLAARLLDLSPLSLVLESGGVDWMRHPAVYAPVGTDSIGPELRLAWRGELAGPGALLVGCALAGVGSILARSARG